MRVSIRRRQKGNQKRADIFLIGALRAGAKPLKSPEMRYYLTARTGYRQFTVKDFLTRSALNSVLSSAVSQAGHYYRQCPGCHCYSINAMSGSYQPGDR